MHIVAKVIFQNSDGKFLLLRRSKTHPYSAYHLDLPGGTVEDGESISDAMVREIREETGIVMDGSNLTKFFEEQTGTHHYILFSGTVESDVTVTLSWEHDQFLWLTLDELLGWKSPSEPDNYYKMVIRALRVSQPSPPNGRNISKSAS